MGCIQPKPQEYEAIQPQPDNIYVTYYGGTISSMELSYQGLPHKWNQNSDGTYSIRPYEGPLQALQK